MLGEFFEQIQQQRERWIFWLPVAIAVGIVIYFSLDYEPTMATTGSFVSLTCIGCYLTYQRPKYLFPIFIALLTIAGGFMLAHYRTMSVAAPVLEKQMGPVWVRGVIEKLEQRTSGYRIVLDEASIWKFPAEKTPRKIRVNVKTSLAGANIGDYVSVKAAISPPPPPVIPGSYDFAMWAYFQQIGAVGYAVTDVEIKEKSEERGTRLNNFVGLIRRAINKNINEGLSSNTESSIAMALLTGEKGAIKKDVLEKMRQSGLGHLLAISGLHLVLVTATFFFLVRAGLALIPSFALNYNIKKWAACAAIFSGFCYLLIAGQPVSAQRAFIMVSIFFLAILVDRTGSPMRPVVWAALIILILTPEVVLSPSFQMSFAAAIALIAGYQAAPWFNNSQGFFKTSRVKKFFIYFFSLVFSSILAGGATAPYSIYHFGHFTKYGIIANAVAIPTTSILVMPAGLLSLMLMPLGLEGLALPFMGWGIDFIVYWAGYVNALPGASIPIPAIDSMALAIITIGAIWLCFWTGSVRLLGLPVIAVGVVMAMVSKDYPDVILDGKGKLFAMRAGTGEYVFTNRIHARYSRERWKEKLGLEDYTITIKDLRENEEYKYLENKKWIKLYCDGVVCEYEKKGKVLKVVYGEGAGREYYDCEGVDLLVDLQGINNACKTGEAEILTKADLLANGTYTITLRKHGFSIVNVKESRGNRPWVR